MRTRFSIFIGAAFCLSIVLAVFVSPLASSSPDGLERVAEDKGFLERAETAPLWSMAPMPDYGIPGREGAVSTSIAGLLGTFIAFLAGSGAGALFLVIRRRSLRAEGRPVP